MTLNSMAPLEPVIGVIGTGYLGTTHAACMAELGFEVVAQDQSRERLTLKLRNGEKAAPIPSARPFLIRPTISSRSRRRDGR